MGSIEFVLKCDFQVENLPIKLSSFHKQVLLCWKFMYTHYSLHIKLPPGKTDMYCPVANLFSYSFGNLLDNHLSPLKRMKWKHAKLLLRACKELKIYDDFKQLWNKEFLLLYYYFIIFFIYLLILYFIFLSFMLLYSILSLFWVICT